MNSIKIVIEFYSQWEKKDEKTGKWSVQYKAPRTPEDKDSANLCVGGIEIGFVCKKGLDTWLFSTPSGRQFVHSFMEAIDAVVRDYTGRSLTKRQRDDVNAARKKLTLNVKPIEF